MPDKEKATFPIGLRVYLRTQKPDGDLHFQDFLSAREVHNEGNHLIVINDGEETLLGLFLHHAVSCILPLQTVGPANADLPKSA